MNKTKIEWADMTWNPVTGCLHGCEYCYARRIAERFSTADKCHSFIGGHPVGKIHELEEPAIITGLERKTSYPFGFDPTFHRYRLCELQHQKNPQNIFVCSMADLFGEWVPERWIKEVFSVCDETPRHRYLFLTKNPKRYVKMKENGFLSDKKNFWYGTTVTNQGQEYFYANKLNTFLSIEPLLEPFVLDRDSSYDEQPKWIIIGAMTGPGSKQHQPKQKWINEIVEAAEDLKIPVFMKDSLIPIVGKENMIRDFPWEVKR